MSEAGITLQEVKIAIDTLWVLLATFLVFFMNLGFAMVESGLCRSKNTVNILTKNFIVFAIATISFWVIGFGLMFSDGNSFTGLSGLLFASGMDNSPATGDAYTGVYSSLGWAGVPFWAKFIFQLVFCGTCATIVSGAVAERIKFHSFLIFSFIICAFIYPLIGHWIWGGGWLMELGMFDFSGSTVIHSAGGWAALAGILMLGPRIGKYKMDGSTKPIYGHNMTSATIGALILWFGWFGFNPGSTLSANPEALAHIAMTTCIAAAMAILSSTVTSWITQKKPDLSMIINGCLAGLVAITAPCAFVSMTSAAVIGAIAGTLVVFSVFFWDKLRIDDPVGALSVHLVNGVFGSLAVGLFAEQSIGAELGTGALVSNGLFIDGSVSQLLAQGAGVLAVALFVFSVSMVVWAILKKTLGLRVTKEEELAGLDIGEHGMEAYSGFQIFNNL
ncbi:MAG: ammonium transporter [Spirochaetales bacterium]|nr:ammonium transporter [Spirochaetales bacterium]